MLNQMVVFYVPSTAFLRRIDPIEHMGRAEDIAGQFARWFGGSTIEPASVGFYRADDGRMIREDIIKVTSFTDVETLDAWSPWVERLTHSMARQWGQECIALQVNGTMHLAKPGVSLILYVAA